MSELLESISGYMSQDNIDQISRSIDATPEQTQKAIGALMPTLIGGLSRNVRDSGGEQRLHQALQRDHNGSIFDHLGGILGTDQSSGSFPGSSEKTMQGGAILDHILGRQKERVGEGVGRASGLSGGQAMKLMMMLAPLVMGLIGKRQKDQGLSPGGLGELIRGERTQVEQSSPAGGLLARMFDQDGDGDFDFMDIMKFGVGRLFNRG